jgi:hypothetical protein
MLEQPPPPEIADGYGEILRYTPVRGPTMELGWIKTILILLLCAWIAACSSVTPQTKTAPANEPKITEEDVTDDRSVQPGPSVQEPQPTPPVEEQPSLGVDTGPRQPRRIEFRDRKGRGKNWKPGESGSEREP